MIEIINPGGFPKGVSIDNILTVSSTPRNKLIADVLEKTGLVERSGQGVDKIYSETLAEGKQKPDYTRTNPYQVTLRSDTFATSQYNAPAASISGRPAMRMFTTAKK